MHTVDLLSGSTATMISGNVDFQTSAPHITKLLDAMHNSRQHVNQVWTSKKQRLEQCFQLRMFEQDVEKMFEWIGHNRELFLVNYTQIGHNHKIALELQTEHGQFAVNSMVRWAILFS